MPKRDRVDVPVITGDGEEHVIRVSVDVEKLARILGQRALRTTKKRATAVNGAISAMVIS
jgi:hypothetical protein